MRRAKSPHHYEPMYGWALQPDGKPLPIAAARRGEVYRCPVCHGEMIAKLGEVKQHHFAHMNLKQCTPEAVARAVAGIWLTDALREALAEKRPLMVEWRLQAGEPHSVDLLQGIARVDHDSEQSDIILHDDDRKRAVIKLAQPEPEEITRWSRDSTAVIVLNPVDVRSGRFDLPKLMDGATVYGGWWLGDHIPRDLITDPETVRATLIEAATRPPFAFCGALKKAFVLEIDEKQLWLPPEMWRDVVGGGVNRIGNGVEVIIQEWENPKGGSIGLFYVTANETYAVAVRAYSDSTALTLKLDTTAFRLTMTTALDVACQLVNMPAPPPD